MPLCALYLISLSPSTSIRHFISTLRSALPPDSKPLVTAKAVRWIIPPWLHDSSLSESQNLSHLTNTSWDLLLIFSSLVSLPDSLTPMVKDTYSLQVGIPSGITKSFLQKTNPSLLHPNPSKVPALTGSLSSPYLSSSTKDLELTPDLFDWITNATTNPSSPPPPTPSRPKGAVSMLNFLSFPSAQTHPDAHSSYQKYGQAFAQSIGSRRGGVAKIVGKIPRGPSPSPAPSTSTSQDGAEEATAEPPGGPWDEIAVAHYPSLTHFADMVASKDYQEVNGKDRKRSLRGTGILCCDELDEDVQEEESRGGGSKL